MRFTAYADKIFYHKKILISRFQMKKIKTIFVQIFALFVNIV